MSRIDVEFSSQGVICRAWWYLPQTPLAKPNPCIVMAHGLGGTRDAGLEPYAEAFSAAGFDVLLFDYRHFGASDGEPRQLLSIERQLADWAAAIAFARQQPQVDIQRIALWGSSFSGGHVIVAAARDGRVAAVSAQCPMMDGISSVLAYMDYAGPAQLLKLSGLGLYDQVRGWLGLAPVYVPLIAPPGGLAAMSSRDAETGYRALVPPTWRNEMTARLSLTFGTYRPIRSVSKLKCPVLIQACMEDTVAPSASAIAAADQLGAQCTLKQYDLGHFEVYIGEGFKRSVADQLAFFQKTLAA